MNGVGRFTGKGNGPAYNGFQVAAVYISSVAISKSFVSAMSTSTQRVDWSLNFTTSKSVMSEFAAGVYMIVALPSMAATRLPDRPGDTAEIVNPSGTSSCNWLS